MNDVQNEVDWMRVGQEDGVQPYIFRKAVEGTMSDRAALDQDASEEWCSSVGVWVLRLR